MEIVGAAASGIAIAQVGVGVGKAVIKAIDLWEQVKNLPEDLRFLIRDLEALRPMLCSIEAEFRKHPSLYANSAAQQCLQINKEAEWALSDLAMNLEEKIGYSKGKMRRTATAVRVALRKEDLARLEKRLDRALGLLRISIDYYGMAMGQISQDSIIRDTSARVIGETKALNAALQEDLFQKFSSELALQLAPGRTQNSPDTSTCDDHCPHRAKYIVVSKSSWRGIKLRSYRPSSLGRLEIASRKQAGEWKVLLQPPNWMSQTIWEFYSHREVAGMQFNLRYYTVRPHASAIFKAVESGDVSTMLALFTKGEASPYDRDEEGSSLLYRATSSEQVEVCRKLFEMGLDTLIDDTGGGSWSPLSAVVWSRKNLGSQCDDTHRALVALFQSYAERVDTITIERMLDFQTDCSYSDDWLRIFQKNFLPKYHLLPFRERVEAVRLGAFTLQDDGFYRYLLREDRKVTAREVRDSVIEGFSLVHSAAIALGKRFADEMQYDPRLFRAKSYNEYWSRAVIDTVASAAVEDLHRVETIIPWDWFHVPVWTGTPLISVLGGALCRISPEIHLREWENVLTGVMRQWLRELYEANVDLLEYGKREAMIWRTCRPEIKGAFDSDAITESCKFERNPLRMRDSWMSIVDQEFARNDNYWIPIRLINVDYGPSPDDWCISWVPEFEAYAGQFWKIVEQPIPVMPGSWVEL